MGLLAGVHYDPGTSVSKTTTAAAAMAAFDTTNARVTFTAPTTGKVLVRVAGVIHGATSLPSILLGVLDGATVKGRAVPMLSNVGTVAATSMVRAEAEFLVTGLTSGQSYTWDAAYGVETGVASSALKYGGANDTTADNAFGGLVFEVWEA